MKKKRANWALSIFAAAAAATSIDLAWWSTQSHKAWVCVGACRARGHLPLAPAPRLRPCGVRNFKQIFIEAKSRRAPSWSSSSFDHWHSLYVFTAAIFGATFMQNKQHCPILWALRSRSAAFVMLCYGGPQLIWNRPPSISAHTYRNDFPLSTLLCALYTLRSPLSPSPLATWSAGVVLIASAYKTYSACLTPMLPACSVSCCSCCTVFFVSLFIYELSGPFPPR